jgi:hypothetical protein
MLVALSGAMVSAASAPNRAFALAFLGLAAACGGESVSHVQGNGMAGMSDSGGTTGTTGGSAATGGTSTSGGVGGTGGTAAGRPDTGGTGLTPGNAGRAGDAGSPSNPGTSGGTSCVTGGACAVEDARCSDVRCCPCLHICQGGVWGEPICSSCVADCPTNPPNNGDACSVCAVPVEGCTWDERVVGPLYTAACVDDHWLVSEEPAGCCTTDAECAGLCSNAQCAPVICVNTECKTRAPNQCWRDDECADDEICSGAFVCGCAADCNRADTAGVCVPRDTLCCGSDADCSDNARCIQGSAVCKVIPENGCYTDSDCPNGGLCMGAVACPCSLPRSHCLEPDTPGVCAYFD